MSHPKDAWKFKLWCEAMLRGAQVGQPQYKSRSASSTGSTVSKTRPKRRRRRKKKKRNAKAW